MNLIRAVFLARLALRDLRRLMRLAHWAADRWELSSRHPARSPSGAPAILRMRWTR